MSAATEPFELPDDPQRESPAAKRREKLVKEARRAAFRLNFTTALFFLIALASLVFQHWLARHVAHRPQMQNIDLEHVSMQDWKASFRLDFPDNGIPAAARSLAPAQRHLPRAIIGGNEQTFEAKKTPLKTPEPLGLKIFVPEGAVPGIYSGDLVVADDRNILPEQKLPIVIEVLDPLGRFRFLLLYFAVVTVVVLLGILWMNPRPYGHLRTAVVERAVHDPASRIQTQEIIGNHRGKAMVAAIAACYGGLWWAFRGASTFDPGSTEGLLMIGLGLLFLAGVFAWTNPFGRKRIPLKSFDDNMPDGEIEFSRTNLLGGRSRLSVVIRIWDEELERMKIVPEWPQTVRMLEEAAAAPPTMNLPHRRPLGFADIFVRPLDIETTRAFCFQFLREFPNETI